MRNIFFRAGLALFFCFFPATLCAKDILSPAQIKNILKKFPQADINKDGVLDEQEQLAVKKELEARREKKNSKNDGSKKAVSSKSVPASHVNERYGDQERNLFDIWIPLNAKNAPLVIAIHGGGFTGGDKSKWYGDKDIDLCLEKGIAYACINYRYRTQSPGGILACLQDSKRALQYLRFSADKYKLNKTKIACYGGSAGAGTSLWLAFHDDMADRRNEDKVLRESTRILAAAASSPQFTYDLKQWDSVFSFDHEQNKEEQAKSDENYLNAYGITSFNELETPAGMEKRKELDFNAMISKDDPPCFVMSKLKDGVIKVGDLGHWYHHPKHAFILMENLKKNGVEYYAVIPEMKIAPEKEITPVEFLIGYLLK